MSVKTFIYGTPLGFNIYEDDSEYKDYFKSFYISSREGRRLMVNRLDNGETTYNFLCYRIAESGNRPNAFFGMSFVLGDYQYCANFSKLYDWFNFLFEKLIDKHNIIGRSENGLYYKVAKFSDGMEDVDWLKNNIPNILKLPDISIERYDVNFSDKRTGKIAQFNTSDSQDTILRAFRTSRWISLSPTFQAQQDNPELDILELSTYLDVVTKQLLPIAIDPRTDHVPLLQKIYSEMQENYNSIVEYVKMATETDNKDRFNELRYKYYDILYTQLPQLAQKISDTSGGGVTSPSSPTPETQRVCKKCMRQKPITAFVGDDDVCIECRNMLPVPTPLPKRYLYWGGAAVAFIAIVISVVVIIVHNSGSWGYNSDNLFQDSIPTTHPSTQYVDKSEYNNYIKANDFEAAYQYISYKDDFETYKKQLKSNLEDYLLSQPFEIIIKFVVVYDALCCNLDINTEEWMQLAKTEESITAKYFQQRYIDDKSRAACKNTINAYKGGKFNLKALAWEQRLAKIPNRPKETNTRSDTEKNHVPIKVYDADGSLIKSYNVGKTTWKMKTDVFDVGGYVDIYCKAEPKYLDATNFYGQEINKKRPKVTPEGMEGFYRIRPTEIGLWIYQCDSAQITIETKRTPQKHLEK